MNENVFSGSVFVILDVSSEVFLALHLGCLSFPPVREERDLSIRGNLEEGIKTQPSVCVALASTGLTPALTLTALGEKKRTGYPRGRGGREAGGVDCQRRIQALKRGLERVQGTVRRLEVDSALVTLAGAALSRGQVPV